MIITVDRTNLLQAAMIHSISWKESHRFVCVPDFVEMHTPERQQKYMQNKMNCGSKFYMLVEDIPVGVISVRESLIEDLYILPDKQKMGYGTKLLRYAIEQCTGIPTLWILENYTGRITAKIHCVTLLLRENSLFDQVFQTDKIRIACKGGK